MIDEYVNWEDLDLDFLLGENNWTDNELLASDKSTSSRDSDDETSVKKMKTASKEINKPNTESYTT